MWIWKRDFGEQDYADLIALYIYPDYQNKGIATRMKEQFEKWGGVLSSHEQPFERLGKGYDEVFYTYNLE